MRGNFFSLGHGRDDNAWRLSFPLCKMAASTELLWLLWKKYQVK